jgi:HipA-like protein
MNEFDVYLLGKLAGELVFDDMEKMTFQYQEDYVQKETIPLSVSMPVREEPYQDKAVIYSFRTCYRKKGSERN